VAEDRYWWWALLNTVMNVRGSVKCGGIYWLAEVTLWLLALFFRVADRCCPRFSLVSSRTSFTGFSTSWISRAVHGTHRVLAHTLYRPDHFWSLWALSPILWFSISWGYQRDVVVIWLWRYDVVSK
jgi:hypothetical protein